MAIIFSARAPRTQGSKARREGNPRGDGAHGAGRREGVAEAKARRASGRLHWIPKGRKGGELVWERLQGAGRQLHSALI